MKRNNWRKLKSDHDRPKGKPKNQLYDFLYPDSEDETWMLCSATWAEVWEWTEGSQGIYWRFAESLPRGSV